MNNKPCLLVEADDFAQIHNAEQADKLTREVLELDNPPTGGHFTTGQAYPVT